MSPPALQSKSDFLLRTSVAPLPTTTCTLFFSAMSSILLMVSRRAGPRGSSTETLPKGPSISKQNSFCDFSPLASSTRNRSTSFEEPAPALRFDVHFIFTSSFPSDFLVSITIMLVVPDCLKTTRSTSRYKSGWSSLATSSIRLASSCFDSCSWTDLSSFTRVLSPSPSKGTPLAKASLTMRSIKSFCNGPGSGSLTTDWPKGPWTQKCDFFSISRVETFNFSTCRFPWSGTLQSKPPSRCSMTVLTCPSLSVNTTTCSKLSMASSTVLNRSSLVALS
mmetsp:Transcript_16162/g.30057  ORF Transcript_16162/g.30057 Transcript_16162/m.30057 type:complete len:278 (+) Transcript_16162:2301-3134(+)